MTHSGSGWASEETKRRVPKKWPGNTVRASTHVQPDHAAARRWCGGCGGGRGIFPMFKAREIDVYWIDQIDWPRQGRRATPRGSP